MALRLVRQTSETPNITNKDDTIMTRYAYGGYNGVVKGFGSECGYTVENGIFKVLDGRIVIDGWEIDVDGAGWDLNLSTVTGTQYHSIYAEINVATEIVKLDSTYLIGSYPEIEKGDDLTHTPYGTARLLLYEVKSVNGVITETIRRFDIIPYLTQKVLDIESRLDKLGFKSGSVSLNEDTASVNTLTRQGNYVIGELSYTNQRNILLGGQISINEQKTVNIGTVPRDFYPEIGGSKLGIITKSSHANLVMWATISKYGYVQLQIVNAGTTNITFPEVIIKSIYFGYEAAPL